MSWTSLVVCTAVGGARGLDAAAAAVAVAATPTEGDWAGTLLLDLRETARPPRGTLLASSSARGLERSCSEGSCLRAAARGRLCFATSHESGEPTSALRSALDPDLGAAVAFCLCDPPEFRPLLTAGADHRRAALLKAAAGSDRSLIALLTAELLAAAIPLKAWVPPVGLIAARRALAGLEAAGESGRLAGRFAGRLAPSAPARPRARLRAILEPDRGQALPAVLGAAVLVVALALILVAVGGAATAKGRMQRAADLASLSAARSMRDDFSRLFVPARRADGSLDPAHLELSEYLGRARSAGLAAAERNGLDADLATVSFPDGSSFAPLRVSVAIHADVVVGDGGTDAPTQVEAEAEVSPPAAAISSAPAVASGGGYSGTLAYRQGEPMRPDVAAAFDLMAAAAAREGLSLTINSAYRSDAEQQQLWDQNPDPRMVAPPGTSLHRCGTELDLGPPEAYGWLAANAGRYDFLLRYPWEAWHFGYTGGPAPCSAEGDRVGGRAEPDGRLASDGGLPTFVPDQFRRMLIESAARYDISPALLAAQLMAESNFNPEAVSPAGAQGIAQFMPGTAAAYGLDDPFDPAAAIDAQARMMSELLARFGSIELALAAYNAGPGAVEACGCVPPYPETQAYVARILGLLGGAGELAGPEPILEIRLVS